jgi:AcrR family transcriptional regulator
MGRGFPQGKEDQDVTRRTYHHGDLRAALVQAGLDAIAENGLAALSVADAARRTGVSPAAPYRHFPRRQALLTATAVAAARELAGDLRAAIGDEAGEAPGAALAATAAVYVRFLARRGAGFDLIFAEELVGADDRELQMAGREVMDLLLPLAMSVTGQDAPAALLLLERHVAAAHGYGALYRSGFLRRRSVDVEVHAAAAAETTRALVTAMAR